MYKMIVTDLDGTLLNKNKNVSEKSKKYLKELKDKGYIICVDTGRTLGRASYALGEFDYINYIICNNGTYIYDVSNVYTDGKVAQIEISDERGNKITYQFDKPKLWKGEPQLDKAHLIGENNV